jgi:hypothetical protein
MQNGGAYPDYTPQGTGLWVEEQSMDRFLDNAARIFEGGRSALQAGCTQSAWTVLIGHEGIRMVADSDWPLESLAREAGAEMAYRVAVDQERVSLQGVSGGRRCSLQSQAPAHTFRSLLASRHIASPGIAA